MRNDVLDCERLLSQREVSQLLRVSENALEAWRVRGGGPRFVRVGRLVRYRASDIRAWIESRLVSSTSEGTR